MNQLAEELKQARIQTDALFGALDPDAFYERPISERHRMVFYLGHLEAFDANQLRWAGALSEAPHPALDKLFEFGIDPEPGQLPGDIPSDWPAISEIQRYNAASRALVDDSLPRVSDDVAHMMIEHRHMHAETFAYILHNLSPDKLSGPLPQVATELPPQPEMVRIPAGEANLGMNPEEGFGWDNEFLRHSVYVPEFSIGKYKVTNSDYLAFVNEGGKPPHYWIKREGRWFYRAMFGEIPLPLAWPVYVSLEQARAYADFRGAEIPTEAQFHRAAPSTIESGANLDYRHWDAVPVVSSEGISQMVGNGWEWTSTVFAPFAGFKPRPSYPGYSANFFDGKHFVLKGASPRTSAKLVRPSLRNWFRPEYPYVYATFRLCQP